MHIMTELIDEFMPQYDVRERHRIRVAASPDATYAALRTADLTGSVVIRVLAFLRTGRRHRPHATLESFANRGFHLIAESPPREMVIGIEGQFWRPSAPVCTPSPEVFRQALTPAPGMARGIWNFTVGALADGGTELTTETRVLCADAATRRRFLPYWYVIRAGSGLIRHAMLRAIRREAEREMQPGLHSPPLGS